MNRKIQRFKEEDPVYISICDNQSRTTAGLTESLQHLILNRRKIMSAAYLNTKTSYISYLWRKSQKSSDNRFAELFFG